MTTNSIDKCMDLEDLTAALRSRLESGRITLPLMPETALEIQRAVSQRGVAAQQLSHIASRSPALAARLLKMTNSAMFQGMSEITDLAHAIGRLGATMVLAVALGAAAKETFRSSDPPTARWLNGVWRSSILAGATARHLAAHVGMVADEAFLAGLLHAVGEPSLCQSVDEMVRTEQLTRPALEDLQDMLGAMRPEAGKRILAHWGVPRRLVLAVEFQASPTLAPADVREAASVTALAVQFARTVVFSGTTPQGIAEDLASTPAALALHLDSSRIAPLLRQALDDGSAMESVFSGSDPAHSSRPA